LILSTIVVGIAHMGDSSALGRIGFRAISWFIIASFISIGLGLLMVNLLEPGVGAPIPDAAAAVAAVGEVKELKATEFILSIFPKNAFEAMATNNILQILVFSLFAGVALAAIGEKGAALVRGADALAEMMLQITGYVMRYAPIAVFGALANVVAVNGLGILKIYVELLVEFYFALLILWAILLTLGWVFLRNRIWTLIRYIRQPLMIAFSTASSEAALPKMFEQLDRFGVPRRISGFILPLGYSFNLDGSMMYMSFATIFIAQAYGIDLPIATQILILLTLMISSKGIAAVPRASLVVITGTLAMFGLPVEGVAIILAIDQFLDMGRTATNVVGNAVATSVITKWEGMLEVEEPEFVEHPHAPAHTAAGGKAGLELAEDMVEDERTKR
jgi:Na+/H+-dicarboxylate symporter